MRMLPFVALLAHCYAEAPLGGDVVVYGEATPPDVPAARADLQPAAPSASHVWVYGYWDWSGSGYVWVPGRWVVPPSPTATWVAPHWDIRGRHHIWVRGYFRQ